MPDGDERRGNLTEKLAKALPGLLATVTPEQVQAVIKEEERPRRFRAGLVSARPAPPGVPGMVASFSASDDLHDPHWLLSGSVFRQRDALVIGGLKIEQHPSAGLPQDGVTRTVLSEIKIPELLRGVQLSLQEHERRVEIEHRRGGTSDGYAEMAQRAAAIANQVDVSPRPGRKGHDIALYRSIALRYLALQDEFERAGKSPRGIVGRLANEPWPVDQERGRKTVPVDTVKSRLRKCAGLGLLTFEGAGRAGAVPGPNLLHESNDKEEEH